MQYVENIKISNSKDLSILFLENMSDNQYDRLFTLPTLYTPV